MIDRLCAPLPPNASPMRSAVASGNAALPSFLSWVQPAVAEQPQPEGGTGAPHPREQGDERSHLPWHENLDANIAIADQNIDPERTLNDVNARIGPMEGRGSDTGPTIEIRIQGENGVHQVITTPWRLMATGELEYGIASVNNPAATPDASTAVVQARQAQRSDGSMRMLEGHTFAALPVAGGTSVAYGMYRNESPAANVSMNGRSLDETLSMAQAVPATAEWLSRWFRWVERDGRDLALWVRDYRIGDREAAGVVNGVLTFVREHGIPVGRIVVNGREHWSRQQPQDHEEPQTCR